MINLLDIKTPAQPQAAALKSDYGLDNHGLFNVGGVYWNLPAEALYEEIVFRREGTITRDGAIVMNTGKHTARSANDKFVVREPSTEEHVWWGQYNRPFAPAKFNELFSRMQGFLQGGTCSCRTATSAPTRLPDAGADHHRVRLAQPLRPEHVHHAKTNEEYRRHVRTSRSSAAGLQGHPADRRHGVEHLHRAQLRPAPVHHRQHRLRGGDQEVGLHRDELPDAAAGRVPHALVANAGHGGDVAVFFGLSGTGKTTLSRTRRGPHRR